MLKAESPITDHVSRCLELAILLEVSAYPKPGNVHRTADFGDTGYEHFLASAVALTPHFNYVAEQGVRVFDKKIRLNQIGIGRAIRNGVEDMMAWQHGGNTLLGSIILLIPMAAAAGLALAENMNFSINKFRANLKSVVESTAAQDAAEVYDAINLAQPGGLGKAPQLDVTIPESRQKILREGIGLFDVFKISAPWDSVSAELVNNYHITFDIGYSFFIQQLSETKDVNIAAVHTYLRILSLVPDTLITRKAGADKARQVSAEAMRILKVGGLTTKAGKNRLLKLDRKLHDPEHKLNPGTTADITSAVLAVAILHGYRP